MSYATVANVKSLFRNLVSGGTPAVTDEEIQDMLDEATDTINAKVGTLYSMPITLLANPNAFNILKRLNKWYVASEVDDILNTYGEADKKPMWLKKAVNLMNDLVPPFDSKTCKQCPPTIKLDDATYTGISSQKTAVKISATTGTQFKKGVDGW